MSIFLSEENRNTQKGFRDFVDKEIAPFAQKNDMEQQVSRDLIEKIAGQGYLGATVSHEFGGSGMDMVTFGLLNEELGRGCSSVRSLITVQTMVTQVIERWGSEEQKGKYLNVLAKGEKIAAFALTEPEFGSDAGGIQTKIDLSGDSFFICGTKKWITFGQIADIFLLLGRSGDKLCAVLVERDTPGLSIEPIRDILGVRGSMLAQLQFANCKIPKTNLMGSMGFGLNPIAFTALDIGRYSIACGCVGLAQASLEAAVDYARSRKQFAGYLREYQLVQEKIANMVTDIRSARLLCYNAGYLKQIKDRHAFREMLIAKYYASNMAIRNANLSVEIHGANGCSAAYPVERYLRDAKIMEIIEGTNGMLQVMISKYGFNDYAAD
jgi:hypothetical protein